MDLRTSSSWSPSLLVKVVTMLLLEFSGKDERMPNLANSPSISTLSCRTLQLKLYNAALSTSLETISGLKRHLFISTSFWSDCMPVHKLVKYITKFTVWSYGGLSQFMRVIFLMRLVFFMKIIIMVRAIFVCRLPCQTVSANCAPCKMGTNSSKFEPEHPKRPRCLRVMQLSH